MNAVDRNNVKVTGNGSQAMVFAHGYGCDQSMWRFLMPDFESHYRLVVFDHVGAGNSSYSAYDPQKYSSLQGYADDLREILRELKLEKTIFVGHSVSAMIGLLAAIREPQLFEHLILIGPSPCYIDQGDYQGGFKRQEIQMLLDNADADYLGWARQMAPLIMGNPDQPKLGAELTNSFCRTHPQIAKDFARVLFLSDNRSDLPKVKVPSLIIQCSQDIVAPEVVGRYVYEHLPKSDLKILKATGHCPHVSAPDETSDAIKHYLKI
jgi:sigma-B regulation protein RsbQ